MRMEEETIINNLPAKMLTNNKEQRLCELLDKQNKKRQLDLENSRNLKNNHENQDYFKKTFFERVQIIENNLSNVSSNGVTTDSGIDSSDPAKHKNIINNLDQIKISIQELQNYLTNSTLFMPDYNIKACQKRISDLNERLEEIKLISVPKKKFGFKNKKSVLPPSIVVVNKSIIPSSPRTIDKIDYNLIDLKTPPPSSPLPPASVTIPSLLVFDWTIQNRCNEEIILENEQVNNKDITISNLKNCLVHIHGHPGTLQLSNIEQCIILCGPVTRSVFGENCTNCLFTFACQQLRLHSSRKCTIYIHVTCRAIIEDSRDITVAPYTFDYANIDIDFCKTGLDKTKNNWKDIADFNWLNADHESPNWKLIGDDQLILDWNIIINEFKSKIRDI